LSYATTQTMSTIKESKTLGDVLSSKKKEKKDKDEAKKEKEKEKDKKKEKRKSEMRTSSSTRELSSNSKIDRRKSEKRAVDVRKNINEDDDRDEVSMTEEESVIKGHEFDKKLWPFRRISAYKVKGQKEGFFKRKIGNGRWAPVWLVMYLDYVLWYKPGKFKTPTLTDLPVGAVKLEFINERTIESAVDTYDLSGLIPKTIHFDHTVQFQLGDKEKLCYLQFDSDEGRDDWADAMKSTIKTLRMARPRVIPNAIELTEQLMNQIPKNNNLGKGPFSGEEERWIAQMKLYYHTREKNLNDVKNFSYFSDFVPPTNASFIEWFLNPGGLAEGTNTSLEKDLTLAEDFVVGKWREELLNIQAVEKALAEPEIDERTAAKYRQKAQEVQRMIDLYHKYQKELYNKEPQYEYAKKKWKEFEIEGDRLVNLRKDQQEKARQEAINKAEEAAKAQEEKARLAYEEKQRQKADPFYIGQDPEDDPFADIKIKTLKL
jgi:flagellar biosynthesis GTPase FlhF